jgi:hypothetical protein
VEDLRLGGSVERLVIFVPLFRKWKYNNGDNKQRVTR